MKEEEEEDDEEKMELISNSLYCQKTERYLIRCFFPISHLYNSGCT